MPDRRERQVNKWIVAMTVMLPTLIEIIDTSIVNVSLDHIRGSFSAGVNEATWAITSYLLFNAIVIPMSGWLSRFFGRKRYQIGSIALFTTSSFLCGSAWSLQSLIFFRSLQGIAGGGLVPVSQAILLERFPPEEHGMAMALFGVGAMFGPIVGPLMGGIITDSWSWRWIFFINIPIGLLAIFLSFLFIKDPSYMRAKKMGIDYTGFALLAVGLGSLQYVLDTGERSNWFGSETITSFTIVAVIALAFFIVHEKYHEQPIVNLSLFRDLSFTSGCLVMFFVFLNLFGSIVLLPIFLQVLMGYTSFYAGLVLGPGGIAALFAMPVVGRLVTRINPKIILSAGIIICSGTTYAMSLFNLQTDFWTFVWPRVTLGIGMAAVFIPTTTLTLSHIPKEKMGEATAIYNMIRNLGGSMGIAFAFTTAARRAQFHQARLVENLTSLNPSYAVAKAKTAAFLSAKGASVPADGVFYRELLRQSNMLGFNDAFFVIALTLMCVLGLVLLMKRPPAENTVPGGQV